MKLFLSESNCSKTEWIRDNMVDPLWQLVEIDYGESLYLELEDGSKIVDTQEILNTIASKYTGPTSLQQAETAATAAKKVFKQMISGEYVKADKETIEKRRNICEECPLFKRRFWGNSCRECGCFVRPKTILLTEFCPLDKW